MVHRSLTTSGSFDFTCTCRTGQYSILALFDFIFNTCTFFEISLFIANGVNLDQAPKYVVYNLGHNMFWKAVAIGGIMKGQRKTCG